MSGLHIGEEEDSPPLKPAVGGWSSDDDVSADEGGDSSDGGGGGGGGGGGWGSGMAAYERRAARTTRAALLRTDALLASPRAPPPPPPPPEHCRYVRGDPFADEELDADLWHAAFPFLCVTGRGIGGWNEGGAAAVRCAEMAEGATGAAVGAGAGEGRSRNEKGRCDCNCAWRGGVDAVGDAPQQSEIRHTAVRCAALEAQSLPAANTMFDNRVRGRPAEGASSHAEVEVELAIVGTQYALAQPPPGYLGESQDGGAVEEVLASDGILECRVHYTAKFTAEFKFNKRPRPQREEHSTGFEWAGCLLLRAMEWLALDLDSTPPGSDAGSSEADDPSVAQARQQELSDALAEHAWAEIAPSLVAAALQQQQQQQRSALQLRGSPMDASGER
ncbi:hypothetical protein JKP88DRAFT_242689 [Tribonema minus]|uniref:Uncharacterized protein n=1 Tax=Tribonema minus TaxID=303371 RepID=A0A835ZH83_9STRA|nr:hypothetical protein JKP88DRAFT_242689 [Tribonema minus]